MPSECVPSRSSRDGVEPDQLQHLVGAGEREAERGAEHAQMAAGGAAGVPGHIAEQGADLAGGVGQLVQRSSVDERGAAARVDAQQQAQRAGLARVRRAEQTGHLSLPDVEAEVGDGGAGSAARGAGQSDGLDHPSTIAPE